MITLIINPEQERYSVIVSTTPTPTSKITTTSYDHHDDDHYHCHNPIMGYSFKIHFLKKIKNKIKAGNVEKADQEELQK